jgi:hypothetical protein
MMIQRTPAATGCFRAAHLETSDAEVARMLSPGQ